MKKLLLCFSLGLFLAGEVNAQVFIGENFNSVAAPGLPTGWTGSGGTWRTGAPDDITNAGLAGIAANTPAHMAAVGYDGAPVSSGTVLALPAVNIPSGATSTTLAFDKAYFKVHLVADPTKEETLTLVVSTNGGSTWTTIQEISGNSNDVWETSAINVGSYAGQNNVRFGFKYEDVNTQLVGLALDNIRLYVQSSSDIALISAGPAVGDASSYYPVGASANITGTVYNYGNTTLTGYTVKYQQGSNAPVSYTVSGSVAPLSTGTFTSSTPFTVPAVGDYPIKVWVELNGDSYHNDDTADAQVSGYSFSPNKRLVFEEATGTWCQWCPRGSVKMREFAEQHTGVAAQIAVHNSDPMAISAYDALITSITGGGWPNMTMDRDMVGDPSEIESLYNQYKNRFGFADVTMGTPSVSGSSVSVPVTIKPAVEINGGKLALVVTEDGVTGTGNDWNQANAYSGGGSGPMGGYENLPDPVVGEVYDFVARSITPSPSGGASGLPSTMAAGSTYTATLTATLDASWNTANLKYVVMLIGANGKVLNSDFTGSVVGIKNVDAGIENAVIYPNPANDVAYLELNIKDASKATIFVTDIMGRSVMNGIDATLNTGENVIKIPTSDLANGMYIVNLNTAKGNLTFKLQVIK